MANGDYNKDIIAALPVWAKLAVIFGPTTGFAFLLLLSMLGYLKSPMTTNIEQNEKILNTLIQEQTANIVLRRQIAASLEYQNVLGRTVCRNTTVKELQYQCEPRYRGYDEEKK